MHHEQPTWPPTPEQITQWLGGFEQATHGAAPARQAERPRTRRSAVVRSALRDMVGVVAFTAVAVAMFGAGLHLMYGDLMRSPRGPSDMHAPLRFVFGAVLLWGSWAMADWSSNLKPEQQPEPATTQPGHPHSDGTPVTVLADAQGIEVRTGATAQREAWLDLRSVQDHGSAMVLQFEYDEALRLPRDDVFEPVLSTARHIAAARAAQHDALLARMDHGLSRAELPVDASRGLSRGEH